MGVAYYLVFDRPVEFETFVSGKALARAEQQIEKICNKLKVKPLSHFVYVSDEELAEIMDDDDLPDGGETAQPSEWFEPAELLTTVRAVAKYLQENGTAVPNSAAVVADLKQYDEVISNAQDAGLKLHISLDI